MDFSPMKFEKNHMEIIFVLQGISTGDFPFKGAGQWKVICIS